MILHYKWETDVPDFRTPVKVTKAPGKFSFIYPTTTRQTLRLPNLLPEDFEVDQDHFYVNVEQEDFN